MCNNFETLFKCIFCITKYKLKYPNERAYHEYLIITIGLNGFKSSVLFARILHMLSSSIIGTFLIPEIKLNENSKNYQRKIYKRNQLMSETRIYMHYAMLIICLE